MIGLTLLDACTGLLLHWPGTPGLRLTTSRCEGVAKNGEPRSSSSELSAHGSFVYSRVRSGIGRGREVVGVCRRVGGMRSPVLRGPMLSRGCSCLYCSCDEGEEVCVWVDIERKVRVSERGRGLFCIDQIYRAVDCEIKTLSSKKSNVP